MTGTAPNPSRREALTAGFGLLGSLVLPRLELFAREDSPSQIKDDLNKLYGLRDPEEAYKAFKELNKNPVSFPSFEQFKEALSVCREAACTIYLLKNDRIASCTSGFLIDMPKERLGVAAYNKRYIVTCDHMRLDNYDGLAQISFPDGTIVKPERQFVEKLGANGIPVKDLRVYECSDSTLKGKKGLPCRRLEDEISVDSFALTYQPLNLRVDTSFSTGASGSIVVRDNKSNKVYLETFKVSKVTNTAAWEKQQDPHYPENSGFRLDGYLNKGGSGAPAVLFTKDGYCVAGLQVSYVPELESEATYTLEIRNDARIVHINNVLDLLKAYSIVRR
jgi:hypothetical protein